MKGVNQMKRDGGWIQAVSYQFAHDYFDTDHEHAEYWQPCRECYPE